MTASSFGEASLGPARGPRAARRRRFSHVAVRVSRGGGAGVFHRDPSREHLPGPGAGAAGGALLTLPTLWGRGLRAHRSLKHVLTLRAPCSEPCGSCAPGPRPPWSGGACVPRGAGRAAGRVPGSGCG